MRRHGVQGAGEEGGLEEVVLLKKKREMGTVRLQVNFESQVERLRLTLGRPLPSAAGDGIRGVRGA